MATMTTEPTDFGPGFPESELLPATDTGTPIISSNNPMKTQVLPLVYIQSKLPFTSITKTSNSNVLVNNISQLQIATLPPKTAPNRPLPNQGVILTPVKVSKPQQLVIHKTNTKFAGTYLTMIKPLSKIPEGGNSTAVANQKVVIAPMPKVIKNRLPVTVTTNSLQPKIAFMPLSIPTSGESGAQKMYNIKIQEGAVQTDPAELTNGADDVAKGLVCDEVIELDSPEKREQEYELSILDDANSKIEKRKEGGKFAKHGISILKKNYQGRNNSINNNGSVLEAEVEVSPVKLQKTERRRKSNFSYRKDYDDVEIVETEKSNINHFRDTFESSDFTLTKLSSTDNCVDLTERKSGDFLEIEVVKEKKMDINMNDDCDLQKILNWDEGVGTLPGSDLKFIMNEFGLLEYVTKEEYDKIVETKFAKLKEQRSKSDFQEEELRCIECGCYGQPSEFITPKYCSFDCQDAGLKQLRDREPKLKKKRKRVGGIPLKKMDSDPLKLEGSGTDDEVTSNENSQDKFAYPWTCSKKGFSWTKYLDHLKVKAAPVKLFKDAFPYNRNGFRPGMKLEGVDPQHPSYFCVLTVAETCGYRLRLHFDGYPENYDFWANADSMNLFPAGWCEKHGHVLQPPPGYSGEGFNWMQYLKHTKSTAAPKHLFVNRAGSSICPNGFRVGMKLEAVDRKNTSLVCVATVRDMMDNRILVHFDSWDDIYDYWADPTSPYIHPVGWCDLNGHNLTPPNDYPSPETFSWPKYLKERKAVAAPVRSFKQRQTCGFKRGMRLECVDRRVPQLIRVATVDDVREHQIRIQFDGWPDKYSYWVDDDSEDIHPVGWCQKTGHPIETPLTPDDVYDFLECPTVGCRGMGHIQGPKYPTHSEQQYCPYSDENIDVDRIHPDRLLTPDHFIESVVPVSREPAKDKPKARIGRPPKYPRPPEPPKEPDLPKDLEPANEPLEEEPQDPPKKPKRKYRKRLKPDSVEEDVDAANKLRKIAAFIEDSKIEPAVKETWSRHSRFLQVYVDSEDDPVSWSEDKVAQFVSTIPGAEKRTEQFRKLEIDGEAFLLLSQRDLIHHLEMKVGPAVKLYNAIVLLRQRVRRMFT